MIEKEKKKAFHFIDDNDDEDDKVACDARKPNSGSQR